MRAFVRFAAACLCMTICSPFLSAQVCTPDTQYTEVGLYPDSLPTGTLGQPYSQVIHVVIPQDTIVNVPPLGMISVDICELVLDSIPNLPAGMTFECNTPDCRWTIDHTDGVTNRACVTLSGTPTEAVSPDDSLLVFASVVPGGYNANTQLCEPLQLQLPDSLTNIEYKTALKLEAGTNSIEKDLTNTLQPRLYPNPSRAGQATLALTLPQAEAVTLRVRDAQGRILQTQVFGWLAEGTHRFQIGEAAWPAGMYFVEVELPQQQQALYQTWIRQ